MNKLNLLKKIDLPRLIVEAVLIFASVYAAFILEDRRSKNFERQIFRDKLQAHLKILKYDSINYEQRLGTSNTSVNNGMKRSLGRQENALELLKFKSPDSLVKVYQMQKNNDLFWWVIQSSLASQHEFEELGKEYSHLIINDSTLHWMRQYNYHAFVLKKFATDTDQLLSDLEDFGYGNYFVLSDNDKEEDILNYVSHPNYYNTILKHIQYINMLYDLKASYDEDFPNIKAAILAEIEAQNELL